MLVQFKMGDETLILDPEEVYAIIPSWSTPMNGKPSSYR